MQSIAGLFNTGVGADGQALAAGTADPHYELIAQPAGSTVTNAVNGGAGGWLANDGDSAWIGASTGTLLTGLYQYQTSFTLQAGADPRLVLINMDISTDDYLRDILVNGVSIGITAGSYNTLTMFNSMVRRASRTALTPSPSSHNRNSGASASAATGLRIDNLTSSVVVVGSDPVNHQADHATVYVEGTPVSI